MFSFFDKWRHKEIDPISDDIDVMMNGFWVNSPSFLALTRAQGLTISVCPVKNCLDQSIFIIMAQIMKQTLICLQAVLKQYSNNLLEHYILSHTVGA